MPTALDSCERRYRYRWSIESRGYQDLELINCADSVQHFIDNWGLTYDPREKESSLPFDLFPRQAELLEWFQEREAEQKGGIVEKSRDMGATWIACAYALHGWLFRPGFSAGFGSRKLELVDRIGDMDSIFEKIRFLLYALPVWFLPKGFRRETHDNHARLVNPENGSTITGEGGDNIGRGGRKTIYFVDEAAFLERPELVDRALSQNTRVRIELSTPNGSSNSFAEKRNSGNWPVFTLHWKDDPRKNHSEPGPGGIPVYPWYEEQKSQLSRSALAQEIDIDYSASVEREWPTEYFPASIWFEEWPQDLTIKTIALDPSKGKESKWGDYSAIIRLGRSADGTLWCDADLARRSAEQIVEDSIEHQAQFRADVFAVETNNFQELLATQMADVSRKRGIMLPIAGYVNTVNKLVRIRRLGPYLAKGLIRFKGGSPGAKLLVRQLQDFPVADHDDGPDGLELALRAMIDLWNNRRTKQPQRVKA